MGISPLLDLVGSEFCSKLQSVLAAEGDVVRTAGRSLGLLISCAFLYQSYDAFRTLRESKEPGGNISWGIISFALGALALLPAYRWSS